MGCVPRTGSRLRPRSEVIRFHLERQLPCRRPNSFRWPIIALNWGRRYSEDNAKRVSFPTTDVLKDVFRQDGVADRRVMVVPDGIKFRTG